MMVAPTTWIRSISFCFLFLTTADALISLRTVSRVPKYSYRYTASRTQQQQDVLEFLATPANWPNIVLSSWSVEAARTTTTTTNPLQQGDSVREIFGLPPILPLEVEWTCVQYTKTNTMNHKGLLFFDVQSPEGVSGIATDCRMLFAIGMMGSDHQDDCVCVDLTVEYEPTNILGKLAIPILSLDNWMALNLFLPDEFRKHLNGWTPLDDFRELMGMLYGAAGVLHLIDCLVPGCSKLLLASGCPAFYDLPLAGQAVALLWCFAGPASYVWSKINMGDIGMATYGIVEVACAALVSMVYNSSSAAIIADTATTSTGTQIIDPLGNAVIVQLLVAAAWVYSASRSKSGGNVP